MDGWMDGRRTEGETPRELHARFSRDVSRRDVIGLPRERQAPRMLVVVSGLDEAC